jgi:AmpD protein
MQLVDGWVDTAAKCPSPNFNARPNVDDISLLVVHNISLPPKQYGGHFIENFFQNCLDWDLHPYFKTIEGTEVSAHFLIKRDGSLIQFVSCLERAWHTGLSCFSGRENCNDYSIGVELEGCDDEAYEVEQYQMLADLTRILMLSYPQITEPRLVGHCDIAPGRKTDPGEFFEWSEFRTRLTD